MSSIPRALRVLEYLAETQSTPTHAELAAALEIPKTTLSDILARLRAERYVQRDGSRYALGTNLLVLSHRVRQHVRNRSRVRRALEELAEATGESTLYSVELDGAADRAGVVFVVDQVCAPNPFRY